MIFVIEFLHQFNVSFNFADDLERKEIEKNIAFRRGEAKKNTFLRHLLS